jgi:NADPH2:quinone reductase
MQAIVNTPQGPIIQRVADPVPAAEEALVSVRAFSVNRGELALLAVRTGDWRPGQDIAGVVVEPAADGSGPAAGARVVALVEEAGWAELAAVPTSRLAELPHDIEIEQAAALPLAGRTALRTIRLGGSLLGKPVLVTGASGGVGQYQVQLAALSGAVVTAVAREQIAPLLTGYGAVSVVTTTAAAAGVYELITESIGGESLLAALTKIAPGGTVVVLGTSSGEKSPIDVYDFIGHENARLVSYLSYAAPDPVSEDLETLVALTADGKLRTTLGFRADWSRLTDTLDALGNRSFAGKAVLTVVA